ncbi:MAG TPA: hypothetical protein VFV92_11480, partial [Candidatus Bathyarchaeia archaeon]|nr:hypothetical protein [Candidatus Bathyarchaeia archaeon]
CNKRAAQTGGFSFGWGWAVEFYLLLLDGEGFGEFEAQHGLGGQDNLLLPGVCRSRFLRGLCGAAEVRVYAESPLIKQPFGDVALVSIAHAPDAELIREDIGLWSQL